MVRNTEAAYWERQDITEALASGTADDVGRVARELAAIAGDYASMSDMDVVTTHLNEGAHGSPRVGIASPLLSHIRALNTIADGASENPEYLRGQVELLASVTAAGDMDAAVARVYADLGVMPL